MVVIHSPKQYSALNNILTYLLMFTLHEQLVEGINLSPFPLQCTVVVFLKGVGGLRMAEHQLGVKKALDKSDTALLLEVRGKLALHCTAQQLRSNL